MLFARPRRSYSCRVRSTSQPGNPGADPDVAAAARLVHRRDGWGRVAIIGFIAFALTYGAYSNAQSQGTPPPSWFLGIVIALGALTVLGIAGSVVDSALLRRRSPDVRAQATQLAARHPSRPHAHHYPPRHWVTWTLRWFAMLLLVSVAVVSVPATVDGVAYLAGAGKMVTFDPVSYQTTCSAGSCSTTTNGILETGGAGTQATWQDQVPLGKPFKIREPVWRWGLGLALISSDGIAVVALVIGLLFQGFAVLVVVALVRLVRHRVLYGRLRTAPVSIPIPGP